MLGDIIVLFLRGGKLPNAFEVLNKLEQDENNIIGIPHVEALQLLLDTCISQNNAAAALVSICTGFNPFHSVNQNNHMEQRRYQIVDTF